MSDDLSLPSAARGSVDVDPRSVFVIHGRNLKVRDEVVSFLRALDLKPV